MLSTGLISNISSKKAFASKALSEPSLCPQQMPCAALLPQLWVRGFCAGLKLCQGHPLSGVCPSLPRSSLGSSAASLQAGDEGLYQKSGLRLEVSGCSVPDLAPALLSLSRGHQ